MCNRAKLLCSSALLAAMLFSSAITSAQNAFASIHQSLNDAADRTLAVTLADKNWMHSPEVSQQTNNAHQSAPFEPLARFRAGVDRVNQLRPTVEPILQDEGVPTDLIAVVLVESGGLSTALSPKGALGLWQLMPDTARRYGLVVSKEQDDRLDIRKSTRAAAHYLRDLYQQFGDWQMALAAYNAGERAVERTIERLGYNSFSLIERSLPLETRDYVPAVLAAMNRFAPSIAGTRAIVNAYAEPRD